MSNKTRKNKIVIFRKNSDIARVGSQIFYRTAEDAIHERDRFTVALSGSWTPMETYQAIAASPQARGFPWEKVHFLWGDERLVPSDHPESNYRLARDTLLSKIPVPPENVHRVPTELSDPEKVANSYAKTVTEVLMSDSQVEPILDLGIQGLGEDGHTASLFPDGTPLEPRNPWVIANQVAHLNAFRISMTAGLFARARLLLFLVIGSGKAQALRKVFSERAEEVPARRVSESCSYVVWLVDESAASLLDREELGQAA